MCLVATILENTSLSLSLIMYWSLSGCFVLICMSSLYITAINLLSYLLQIFSPGCNLTFTFLFSLFTEHQNVRSPDLIIFTFVVSPIALGLESPPPHQGLINMLINFIQVFSVIFFFFSPLIYPELILLCGMRYSMS